MESPEKTKKGFSFGFSKVKSSNKITGKILNDEDEGDVPEKDYVTSIDGKNVKSLKPVEETKPLVIPLIEKNRWRIPKPEDLEKADSQPVSDDTKNNTSLPSTGDEVTDKAVEEILSEARKEQELWETRGKPDPNRAIPLLLKNKVPDGFETDEKLDVALRPDEAAEADYEQIPIEEYGMAMLRGMGFKKDEGIGRKKKRVPPIEAVARPKGLGLGADRSLSLQQKNDGKPSAKHSDDEQLLMKKGSYCIVRSGRHQDMYATVEGIDEDNARVVIRLTLGGSVVTLNQMAIKLVTQKEYDKYSKYLNKSKVDKYKAEQEKKYSKETNSCDSESGSDLKHHRHKKDKHSHHVKHCSSKKDRYSDEDDQYSDNNRMSSSDKHHKHSRHRSRSPIKEKKAHKHKEKNRPSLWLHPLLRVRMIDPEYKKGKYYKTKLVIEDVVSLDSCMCRTDDGKILEGLSQSQLETVIPKTQFACVMVVSGPHEGQIGEIIDWDKHRSRASVQLLPDKDEILTLDYDDICEYTGDVHGV